MYDPSQIEYLWKVYPAAQSRASGRCSIQGENAGIGAGSSRPHGETCGMPVRNRFIQASLVNVAFLPRVLESSV